jgi:hypothetical protein
MLLIDGETTKCTLYLPKADPSRAAVGGALLSPDDPAAVIATTGVDEVKPVDALEGSRRPRQGGAARAVRPIPAR